MKRLYRLMLEKWMRDVGLSTAAGMTAGMQAAFGDADKPLSDRVDEELFGVLEKLQHPPAPPPPALTDGQPPKRGPGRPRKNAEGTGGAGDAASG